MVRRCSSTALVLKVARPRLPLTSRIPPSGWNGWLGPRIIVSSRLSGTASLEDQLLPRELRIAGMVAQTLAGDGEDVVMQHPRIEERRHHEADAAGPRGNGFTSPAPFG